MQITIFQAITLLAKYYRHTDKEIYNQIESIYLSGIRSEKDEIILAKLLNDKILQGYDISDKKEDINEDPVRRYFEGQLCHETLRDSLDKLNVDMLQKNFDDLFDYLPFKMKILIPCSIYLNVGIDMAEKISDTAREYAEGINTLKSKNTFQSLQPKFKDKSSDQLLKNRKEKMILIAKSSHASMVSINQIGNQPIPLDLYNKKDYVFDGKNRGRQARKDCSGASQNVKPHSLGIMRSFMPLPLNDCLFAEEPANYVRPADRSTYVEGAQQPEKSFKTKVTPFVNSISGTLLCQLRLIADLFRKNKFVYGSVPEQLELYFQCFIAYMAYNAGGHSLNEFTCLFELPEVKKEFAKLPGFEQLNLDTLFRDHNEAAFERALDQTIAYQDVILARKNAHKQILARESTNEALLKKPTKANQETIRNHAMHFYQSSLSFTQTFCGNVKRVHLGEKELARAKLPKNN